MWEEEEVEWRRVLAWCAWEGEEGWVLTKSLLYQVVVVGYRSPSVAEPLSLSGGVEEPAPWRAGVAPLSRGGVGPALEVVVQTPLYLVGEESVL